METYEGNNYPKKIELTTTEGKLYQKIPLTINGSTNWSPIAVVLEKLFNSLIERKAIPKVRLQLFADPKYAESRGKSSKQIFESNGTSGSKIYRHPHFVKYLHYFINGPALSEVTIQGFCKIIDEDIGTSSDLQDQLCKYVRACVRSQNLNNKAAATSFYRLAVEVGLNNSHTIRKAAQTTR